MGLEQKLQDLILKQYKESLAKETALAQKMWSIYYDASKELQNRLTEALAGQDTLKIDQLQGTLNDIDRRLQYYTDLVVHSREEAIENAQLMGQHYALSALQTGGVDAALAVGVGLINKGMVEALIGDIPKLTGVVHQQVMNRIQDQLARGAAMGESIPKLAKRVFGTGLTQEGMKKPFATLQQRCTVIARTEIIKASDQGYHDMTAEAQQAVDEPIYDAWITAGDDRVESQCRAIANGTDPRFKSIPGHPGVYDRENGPRPVVHTHPQ